METKIFVINLERSVDRRESMKRQLEHLALPYEFVKAVDGNCLTTEQLSKYSAQDSLRIHGRELTRAEIGCALSHLGIYHRILDERLRGAFVFEDDLRIGADFVALIANRHRFPRDWELIKFCHANPRIVPRSQKTIMGEYRIVKFASRVAFAAAYVINQKGAAKLIKYAYPIRFAADGLTGRFMETGVRLYGIVPQVITQGHFPSTIQVA